MSGFAMRLCRNLKHAKRAAYDDSVAVIAVLLGCWGIEQGHTTRPIGALARCERLYKAASPRLRQFRLHDHVVDVAHPPT